MRRNVQKYFIQKRSSKQNSQQKLDKAPLLSISNDIWILSSDTFCQLNQLFSNSEAAMLSKKLRSTLALQIARSAFCTGNQCMICLHWNGKDLMQCVFSSDTFWRIQAVWAGQRSGTWRSERVSWVQDSHHRLGPQNFLVYTHCEVVTMHSIPIQWLH